MASDKSVGQSFWSWIKQPVTWFSLVSFVVSMVTFYLVYVDEGTLKPLFPPEVAVSLAPDGTQPPLLLVPMTFHFTGASSRQEVITQINATVTLTPEDGSTSQTLSYAWRRIYRLIGQLEYERLYPEQPHRSDIDDSIAYESRNVPFALKGHEVSFKLLGLEPEADPDPDSSFSVVPAHLEVCLDVSTIQRSFQACQAHYYLSAEAIKVARATGRYEWIRQDIGN